MREQLYDEVEAARPPLLEVALVSLVAFINGFLWGLASPPLTALLP